MPWNVENDNPDCAGYAVVVANDGGSGDGKVVGCHDTKAEADAQVRALYANDAMNVRRFQFHLQGEHDQQNHAGGRGGQGDIVGGEGDSAAAERSLGRQVKTPSRDELLRGFDPVPDTPRVESTFLDHMDDKGNLTPERQKVHDDLIKKALSDEDGNPLPSQDKPKALMMGGGAASGKSSAIQAGFVDSPEDAALINPDEFKVQLPESSGPSKDGKQGNGLADKYGDAWASITHEESSHLGKRLTAAAVDRRTNILIDKTSSDGPKAVKQVKELQDQGYDVEVAYVTTDIDQAVANALSRQEKVGRAVPEEVLRAGHTGANAAFIDVATQTTAKTQLVTTVAPAADGTKMPPVLTASTNGDGVITVHNTAAWEAYLGRIPSLPEAIKIREEALAASAAFVASSGTVPSMISEDRMKVLYGHAIAGKTPPDMNDEEKASFDRLVTQVADIKGKGNSPDFPIDDIFDGDGPIAVTEEQPRDGQMTARTFKAPATSPVRQFHLQGEHDQQNHAPGGGGGRAKPAGGGQYADVQGGGEPIDKRALEVRPGTLFSPSTRLQGRTMEVMNWVDADRQGLAKDGYIVLSSGRGGGGSYKNRTYAKPTGKIVKANRTRPGLVEFEEFEIETVVDGGRSETPGSLNTIVGAPGKPTGRMQYALIEHFPKIPDYLGD